jgi:D-inositol-3-phosphate glycosyltransferase
MPREAVAGHLDAFADEVDGWRLDRGLEYDVIYAHYWLSGAVGLTLHRRWGVPLVQMFHTLARLKNAAARSSADLEPALRIAAEAELVGAVDRIVAATAVERQYLIREHGADAGRITVVPCGVDTDLFRPGAAAEARRALALDDRPLILYVGRLAPIKGVETLLDAVALLRAQGVGADLLVVGGDADEPLEGHEGYLRRRVVEGGLGDCVRFLGPQPQDRLRGYYVAADVTVLPSHYESFGMVALEAMACGSPVVASRVGGLATIVRDGATGYLVPEGDVSALAARLSELIADPDLRERMGREGVRWAALHRWPCVAEAICREFAALSPAAGSHLASGRCR